MINNQVAYGGDDVAFFGSNMKVDLEEAGNVYQRDYRFLNGHRGQAQSYHGNMNSYQGEEVGNAGEVNFNVAEMNFNLVEGNVSQQQSANGFGEEECCQEKMERNVVLIGLDDGLIGSDFAHTVADVDMMCNLNGWPTIITICYISSSNIGCRSLFGKFIQ